MLDHLDVDQLERDQVIILQPLLELDYSKFNIDYYLKHVVGHGEKSTIGSQEKADVNKGPVFSSGSFYHMHIGRES